MYRAINEADSNGLKEILNFASDIFHGRKDSRINKAQNSYTSIARATSDLIAVYPVCGSNTLSIDSLSIITKAIERKGVTMLQLLLAAKNLSEAKDGIEYLKQFHNNLNIRSSFPSVDEWINIMDNVSKSLVKEGYAETVITTEATEKFVNWLKYENNIVLPESLNTHSIQDFKVTESADGYTVSFIPLSEAIDDDIPDPNKFANGAGDLDRDGQSWYNAHDKHFNTRLNYEKFKNSKKDDDRKYELSKQSADRDVTRNDFDFLSKQLLDNEVKKSNELVPSLLIVKFTNVESGVVTNFIIGVKAKLISCSSFELIERITKKNRDNRGLVKLIRATTGELNFFKDFLFGIDDAKIDVLSKNNKGSKSEMWRVLERRSYKTRRNIQRGSGNDSAAITTMVLSQPEIEYIMKQYSMNMEDPSTVQMVMNSYNLLCFCIVDESLEIARFFFDGDDDFEDLSFDFLQRENGGDNMYKKVINLMSRIK